ncbi:MAG: YcjF family protein [Verrucomicrobia bacterium]|nr:YcjF family protein [Verrucomicrobiota bacterium]
MIQQVWRIATRLTLFLGALLSLIVLAELVRTFAFFYHLHPAVAWTYACILAGIFFVGLVYFWIKWLSFPRVLAPPPLPALDEATHAEMKDFCRYLSRYLRRLARNSIFDEGDRRIAGEAILHIDDELRHHPLNDDLIRLIEKTEADAITPLLEKLRDRAQREVRNCVRDVMIGVTLSPFHSIDLIVVIYRNAAMILRLITIYRSRPDSREQFMILRDVLKVIVTINFLNIGRNLSERLFSQVPMVGRVIEEIGQGLGAGLLTSAAGHAAIDRCEAFRTWNRQEAALSLAAHSRVFLDDVRKIFTHDVLPDLRNRIKSEPAVAEAAVKPNFWESVSNGVTSALDATARTFDDFVVQPTVAGTVGVVRAGAAVTRGAARAGEAVARPGKKRRRKHRRGILRVAHTAGQRLKYTLFPGHRS